MKVTLERRPEYQEALKSLVLAQFSENPLDDLLTARENLVKLIAGVREVYVDQADKLLQSAGAKGEIELVDLISEGEILGDEQEEEGDDEDYEGKSKGPVGFQRNEVKITGD
ncbi:hypothetical protein SEA_MOLIVIA_73 [Arthrobacter phage Molivia]|uniref:Uncharacterized protein n=1 Tax=Arthrobacter phage Molivia TaxID=2015839 RepID=A0A286S2E0_9CAUD|nr:hypothetical protein FDI28_gp43 [Arthrobacter phage Molivia]ASX99294.1 hypothetical protein SEA_MOLIVIA_73 [Arthrobacter phage Molivia]